MKVFKYYNKEDSSMNKLIIIMAFAFILVMGLASPVVAELGTFKPGSCVSIRALGNCTLTLNEVTSPSTTYAINTAMTNLAGQTYNYTFCNTSTLGKYTFSWSGSCLNCGTDNCGNSFQVGNPYIPLILGGIAVVLLMAGFIRRNEFFGLFSAFAFIVLGVYSMIYGLGFGINETYSQMSSFIILGIGIIIGFASVYEMYYDGDDED